MIFKTLDFLTGVYLSLVSQSAFIRQLCKGKAPKSQPRLS